MTDSMIDRLGRESCCCVRMALRDAIRNAEDSAARWDERESWDALEQASYWRKVASQNRRALAAFEAWEYPDQIADASAVGGY